MTTETNSIDPALEQLRAEVSVATPYVCNFKPRRSTPRKDIKVFLQSGENDAATLFGDWPLANQTMTNALEYAGYECRFEFGTGGHTIAHGGALFADSIRWLLQ